MDLNKTLQECIAVIQQEQCVNCKYGQAVLTLNKMIDREEPEKAPAKPCQKPVIISQEKSKAERKREYQRKWLAKKQAAEKARAGTANPPTSKTCTSCGEEKPLEQFHLNRQGKLGRDSQCAKCKNEALGKYKKPAAPEAASAGAEQDKPHACDKCGKRFMALGSLIQHGKYNCPGRATA
jgi:hypothetical protein